MTVASEVHAGPADDELAAYESDLGCSHFSLDFVANETSWGNASSSLTSWRRKQMVKAAAGLYGQGSLWMSPGSADMIGRCFASGYDRCPVLMP